MTELADVADLKSADRIIVRVQIPLGALTLMLGSCVGKFHKLLVNAQISGVEWVYNHLNV